MTLRQPCVLVLAAAAFCATIGPRRAPGQIVDSPGGSVQMVPGGAVGKGDTAKGDTGDAGKTAFVAPSDDEQLSRALLALKAQRAVLAGKAAAGDPQLRDLDDQMSALREKIALRSVAFADLPDSAAAEPLAAPVFPRIVPEDLTPIAPFIAPSIAPSFASARPVPPIETLHQEPAENAAVRRVLEQTPVSLIAEAQGLEKVLDNFRDQTHLNLWINWTALATVNVDRNTPVSVNLQQVPAERLLKVLLSQVGGGTANLATTIDGGILTLSTKDDLSSAKYQEVRVYDIRDLLAADSNLYAGIPVLQVYASRAENLIDTIKSIVAPDTWRDSGGTIGSIRELNGLFIINQTTDNHRAIEDLLAKLRRRN